MAGIAGTVGDLDRSLVAEAELFAHDLDDVIRVAVVLGEDQRLRDIDEKAVGALLPVGEHGRKRVPQRPHDRADLVGRHDAAVQLGGVVVHVLVDQLEALLAGQAVAELRDEPGRHGAAALGDLGADAEHVEVHVHPVRHRLGVAVLGDQVLLEEGEGLDTRRGGQADDERVEVLQHLPPHPVNGAVALVDDDHVVGLDGHRRVVDHLHRLLGRHLEAGLLVDRLVDLLAPQQRVQPLDRRDVHLGGAFGGHVEMRGGEPAHVVQLSELPAVVRRLETLELPHGLAAQTRPIHQEQHTLRPRVSNEPVDGGDSGERLARSHRHLDQRPRPVVPQRRLQAADRPGLGVPQLSGIEIGQQTETGAQCPGAGLDVIGDPPGQRLGPVEAEHPPRRRHRIQPAGEPRLHTGGLVTERQHPAHIGRRQLTGIGPLVAQGLRLHPRQRRPHRLRLDHPHRLAVHEQHIVGPPDTDGHLSYRHTLSSRNRR